MRGTEFLPVSREEMIDLLLKNEYGYFPDIPYEVSVSDPVNVYTRYCNSSVVESRVKKQQTNIFPFAESISVLTICKMIHSQL